MRLAFCFSDMHQIALVDPCLPQNGTCDFDVVILGERAHNAGRRIRNGRNAAGEFSECLCFDFFDQATDDIVEQRDVLGVEARHAVEEQSGDAAEGFRTLFRRTMLDDVFQFRKQRRGNTHTKTCKTLKNRSCRRLYANLRADSEGTVIR